MISAVTLPVQSSPEIAPAPTKPRCVKALAESGGLSSIPPSYMYPRDPNEPAASETEEYPLPIIDFSLLTSGDPKQRSQAIQDLGKACQEWGYFEVVNHGVPERLMDAVIDVLHRFFSLREEEKQEFEGKHVLDPITCGTSFNTKAENVFFWRDFLKVFVHPEFHSPNKPEGFREVAREYSKETRRVARELLKGISKSLGMEECFIENAMDFESGYQLFAANLYPPCPQPELAMGLPPHSDFGLLTMLIQNENGGLQVQRDGKWFKVNARPYSFMINVDDHLEILTNGRYKSAMHQAVVNNKNARISVPMAIGPALDCMVSPAQELLDRDGDAPAYLPMKFKEYLELRQSNKLVGKSSLDRVRLRTV